MEHPPRPAHLRKDDCQIKCWLVQIPIAEVINAHLRLFTDKAKY